MSPKKDWQVGIRPTPKELAVQVDHIRAYVRECQALVDELFPEDRILVAPPVTWRQYQDRP